MKRTLSIAACATAMLAAAKLVALPIDNRVTPDGTPVLIPAVQQYQARKGTLVLPDEFTFTAPVDADNEADVLTELVKRHCSQVPRRPQSVEMPVVLRQLPGRRP